MVIRGTKYFNLSPKSGVLTSICFDLIRPVNITNPTTAASEVNQNRPVGRCPDLWERGSVTRSNV